MLDYWETHHLLRCQKNFGGKGTAEVQNMPYSTLALSPVPQVICTAIKRTGEKKSETDSKQKKQAYVKRQVQIFENMESDNDTINSENSNLSFCFNEHSL